MGNMTSKRIISLQTHLLIGGFISWLTGSETGAQFEYDAMEFGFTRNYLLMRRDLRF